MSVSLNTNMLSLNVANTYNKNVVGLQNSMNALSTGQRINYAGDDPAGMGISERLRTRIDSLDQASKNIQNDNSILKIADGALTNMADIVSSIREKLVQAANDSTAGADRARLGKDIDNLINRYEDVVKDAKYGDNQFFVDANGFQKNKFNVQGGADKGDNFALEFTALDATKVSLTTANYGSTKLTSSALASVASGMLASIDAIADKIYLEQSKIGSYEQRLGYLADNRTAETTALRELESGIRDTDVAKGMTDFMRYNIRTQTSQYMMAQANQVPAMVLQLLQP